MYGDGHDLDDLEGQVLGDRAGQAEDVDGQTEHTAIVEVRGGSQPLKELDERKHERKHRRD